MKSIRRFTDWPFIVLVILVVISMSFGGYALGYLKAKANGWPVNVDDAATLVISRLDDEQKEKLASTPRDQLIQYHFSLGMAIRNDFGLWDGNVPLLDSASGDNNYYDPDDASFEIIKRTWQRLQKHAKAPGT